MPTQQKTGCSASMCGKRALHSLGGWPNCPLPPSQRRCVHDSPLSCLPCSLYLVCHTALNMRRAHLSHAVCNTSVHVLCCLPFFSCIVFRCFALSTRLARLSPATSRRWCVHDPPFLFSFHFLLFCRFALNMWGAHLLPATFTTPVHALFLPFPVSLPFLCFSLFCS